jgi:hypothetical protein
MVIESIDVVVWPVRSIVCHNVACAYYVQDKS